MSHSLLSLPHRSQLPSPPTGLEAHFDVSVEADRHLVRYTMAGFFDRAMVASLKARRDEAVSRLRCVRNTHVTLLDISGCRIQSQETISLFGAMLNDPRHRSRAIAVVVGGSLARMQVTRILDRPDVGLFATVDEAEAWLFGDAVASFAPDRGADRREAVAREQRRQIGE